MPQDLFNRETYTEGGGLIDDVDVTIRNPRFGLTDYRGSASTKSTALLIDFETEDGEVHEEIYSIGRKAEKVLRASKDGKKLEAKPGQQEVPLNVNSKAGRFFLSLLDAGFEGSGADVGVLDGLTVHVKRKTLPKIEGGDASFAKKDPSRPDTVLLIAEIRDSAATSSKPAAKKPATGTAKAGAGSANGFEATVAELIEGVLMEEAGAALAVNELRRRVFKAVAGREDANRIVQKVADQEWLKTCPQFTVNAGMVGIA